MPTAVGYTCDWTSDELCRVHTQDDVVRYRTTEGLQMICINTGKMAEDDVTDVVLAVIMISETTLIKIRLKLILLWTQSQRISHRICGLFYMRDVDYKTLSYKQNTLRVVPVSSRHRAWILPVTPSPTSSATCRQGSSFFDKFLYDLNVVTYKILRLLTLSISRSISIFYSTLIATALKPDNLLIFISFCRTSSDDVLHSCASNWH